jgi:3-methyl-2-oxobutanoate hydroxymethyltransferase
MGSYELSPEQALQSAIRMVKEGGIKGVKLEGARTWPLLSNGSRKRLPPLWHTSASRRNDSILLVGLGYRGSLSRGQLNCFEMRLLYAGAFMVLVKPMPAEVAAIVMERVHVPTIGIESGGGFVLDRFWSRWIRLGTFRRGGLCRNL